MGGNWPSDHSSTLPGAVDVTGGFTVMNEKSEPVACINLDAHIPAFFDEEEPLESEKACIPASSDHISNIVTQGATTTMDLDEDLDFVNVAVDIGSSSSCSACAAPQDANLVHAWNSCWQAHICGQEPGI